MVMRTWDGLVLITGLAMGGSCCWLWRLALVYGVGVGRGA
jgi:hypothetical protein